MYDLIIIGGGPAGLTAAVYAARKLIKTLLISQDLGGQVNETLRIENYMGYQFVEGPELIEKFNKQVTQYPLEQKVGSKVSSVSRLDCHFEVNTESGETFQSKAVILATGKRSRSLNVPGEAEYRGKGVSYCAICDAPVFTGMKVAVVGGGNSALEASYDLIKMAEHVYIVSLTPLTGDPITINRIKDARNLTILLEYQVEKIEGDKFVEAVHIKNIKTGERKRLEVAGIFVEIGLVPNSEPVKEIAVLNQWGEVKVSTTCETGVPGLFAAGDVTDTPEKQIVIAAGEGAKAALQADRYIRNLGG